MNPIRKLLIRLGVIPITPDDLVALLNRAEDRNQSWKTRLDTLIDYAVLTQDDTRLEELFGKVWRTVAGERGRATLDREGFSMGSTKTSVLSEITLVVTANVTTVQTTRKTQVESEGDLADTLAFLDGIVQDTSLVPPELQAVSSPVYLPPPAPEPETIADTAPMTVDASPTSVPEVAEDPLPSPSTVVATRPSAAVSEPLTDDELQHSRQATSAVDRIVRAAENETWHILQHATSAAKAVYVRERLKSDISASRAELGTVFDGLRSKSAGLQANADICALQTEMQKRFDVIRDEAMAQLESAGVDTPSSLPHRATRTIGYDGPFSWSSDPYTRERIERQKAEERDTRASNPPRQPGRILSTIKDEWNGFWSMFDVY